MSDKNIIIFNSKNIEIFDVSQFKTILTLNYPSDIELMSACLYNDKILFIGTNNEELIEFEITNNILVEIDRFKLVAELNHSISHIYKLKNGSVMAIGDGEIYFLKPIQ